MAYWRLGGAKGSAYRAETNRQRAFTVTCTRCCPGSIGVGAAVAIVLRTSNRYIGRGPASAVLNSIRAPSEPPAARASVSASARARATPWVIAACRAESLFDAKKSRELI